MRLGDWAVGAALAAIVLLVLLVLVYWASPGYLSFTDCTPYVIQAHIFAEGQLTQEAPPARLFAFFRTAGMMRHDDRFFSRQPPGASAVFALPTRLAGDVRWAPPLVTALAVFLSFLWIRVLYDRRLAALAVVLLPAGTVFVQVGASALSYPASLLFFSAAMLCYMKAVREDRVLLAFLCGVFLGLQFTVRPYTALLIGAALALSRLWLLRRYRHGARDVGAILLGALPGVALLLLHNHAVTERFWPLAFSQACPQDVLGFGERGLDEYTVVHTPAKAVRNLLETLWLAGLYFFCPVVWLVPIGLWLWGWVMRIRRTDRPPSSGWESVFVVVMGFLVVGHMAYWYPRPINYFETYPLLAVLIALGLRYLQSGGRLSRTIRWAAVMALVTVGPWMTFTLFRDAIAPVRPIVSRVREATEEHGRIVLFSRPHEGLLGNTIPSLRERDRLSAGLFNLHPPARQPVLHAVDLGPEDVRVLRAFPRRKAFLLITPPSESPDAEDPFAAVLVPMTR